MLNRDFVRAPRLDAVRSSAVRPLRTSARRASSHFSEERHVDNNCRAGSVRDRPHEWRARGGDGLLLRRGRAGHVENLFLQDRAVEIVHAVAQRDLGERQADAHPVGGEMIDSYRGKSG